MSKETRSNILAYLDSLRPDGATSEQIQKHLQIDPGEVNNTLQWLYQNNEVIVENGGKVHIAGHLAGQFQLGSGHMRRQPKKIKLRGAEPARWEKVGLFVLAFACVLGLIFLAYRFPERPEILAYVSGLIFVGIIIIIALFIPTPTRFQFFVFRTVFAIFVAAIASFVPGLIKVNVPDFIKAGGPIAVFVIVYFWNPGQYATN